MDKLETIWNQVSRLGKDGKKYIYFKSAYDLLFLFASGFVDSKKYDYQKWQDSFLPSRLKDGAYLITFEQWMEKKVYHYTGPVGKPFDPMAMEERLYTEEEFNTLLKQKVIPETIFAESQALTFINNLKAQGRLIDGKLNIDKDAKKFMLQFLNTYPSPMRVLRIQVDRMKKGRKGAFETVQAQAQQSGFAVGMTAQQITAARLAELSKAPAKPKVPESQKEGLSLKELQKKRPPAGRI